MNWKNWLLDLFFPPKCPFCGAILGEDDTKVCRKCILSLPYTREGDRMKADFMTKIAASLYYEGSVRRSLHRYKFRGMKQYAHVYGDLLAKTVTQELAGEYDLLSWVPLSGKRLRQRGYDQARLLAEEIAQALGMEAIPLLEKIRHTTPQSTLDSPEARRGNISGCYRCIAPETVQGKRILLVDDIVTTGATLSECARTLLMAGAESVCAVALAKKRS